MERLKFTMPEWTRVMWINEKARAIWQPRISKLVKIVDRISVETVALDIRKGSYIPVYPDKLADLSEDLSMREISIIPIQRANDMGHYTTSIQNYTGGPNWYYMCAITKPKNTNEVVSALKSSDTRNVGEVLGYPRCCVNFFADKWDTDNIRDLTWPMAINTRDPEDRTVEIDVPIESNTLLRWLGIRPIFHLPHQFDCKHSLELGRQHIEIGKEMGYKEEMKWMEEMLSWPMEWSALHGIAEIKTPILKISSNTDATPYKYTVRSLGSSYPEEGAIGLQFPYRPPRKKFISDRKSHNEFFKVKEQDTVMPLPVVDNSWLYTDNDFNNLESMRNHHEPLANAIGETIGDKKASILDLGCGNGFLLLRVMKEGKDIMPHGIDIVPERIQHAHQLFPKHKENFVVGDLADYPWLEDHYDLVILMPGRFENMDPDKAKALKDTIRTHADKVLVYAYGDWIKKFESLEKLCERFSIKAEGKKYSNNVAEAMVINANDI